MSKRKKITLQLLSASVGLGLAVLSIVIGGQATVFAGLAGTLTLFTMVAISEKAKS